MRLFVAVPVPAPARDRILPALAELRRDDRLAWTRPDGWHATLAFLGQVEDTLVDEVAVAVAEGAATAGARPFRVSTAAARTLARGTALALELVDEPAGAMADLGQHVQGALADAGFDVTERRVRPHLTVGRARRRDRVPQEVVDALAVPAVEWGVDRLEVVQSITGPGPAAYASVATVSLA